VIHVANSIAAGVTTFTIEVTAAGRAPPRRNLPPRREERFRKGVRVVHCITFELVGVRLPTETAKLESTIREMGEAYQFQKSVWFVESELSNTAISERLVAVMRPNDRLLVARVYKDWVMANAPQAELDWLSGRNYAGVGDPPLFPR
jgi:hypothetical protein